MGLLGRLLRLMVKSGLLLAAFAAVVLLVPGLPPYTTFSEIHLAQTLPREGVLAPNNALDGAKHFLKDKVHGPEAFQVHNGELYTSLGTGEIVKLSSAGHVTFVTKIGQPCQGVWQEDKCGRPLGFRIDAAGRYLYAADAYYGIWRVELASDRKQLLVSPRVAVGGRAPRLFNSLALAANGDLYWTDSSSDFPLRDGAYTSLVDPSGRLFHYNAARNESVVLLDGLWFSNGVAVSPGEEFVIVSECLASRIHRVYVKGPKKGQKDIFIDGLPGTLDNIQPLADGSGVLVALYNSFDEERPMISRSLSRFPLLRKLLARVQRLVELPFEYLQQLYPHYIFEKIVHTIGHFSSMAPLIPKVSGLIQLDWNGNVVGAWFNQDGSALAISDAIVYKDLLYLGSPNNPYVATLPAPEQLKCAFTQPRTSPPPKASEPVMKTEEKPKATTPPPKKAPEPAKKTTEPPKATQAPPKAPEPVRKPTEQPKTKQTPSLKTPEVAKKPTDQVKPTEAPATKKVAEPVAAKKEEPAKPTVSQKNTETKESPKVSSQKPRVEKTTEEPAKVSQPTPAVQQPRASSPKPKETPKTEATAKPSQQPAADKKRPEQIPIVEDIATDTVKPTKEPLKVIKREGPAEIPNPEL